MTDPDQSLRALPKVQRVLDSEAGRALGLAHGTQAATDAVRHALETVRAELLHDRTAAIPTSDDIAALTERRIAERQRPGLRATINATGIMLHTNLGRAPMAEEALAAVERVARSYSNLEFDLESGERGSRTQAIEPLLCALTGAEAALGVNNGAAAILLALSALSDGGGVIVSRGELVEIGGGFRIPDVIRQGGARLVEVGATNRTRASDYRDAVDENCRILLKVHQSNFRTIGFTCETSVAELAALARDHGLMVVCDLGSGLLRRSPHSAEPTVEATLAAGADLVTFSGDKLLGGPQAGIIVGRKVAVDPLRRHPLMRALRLDKMTLAALEATLMLHRDAPERVPVVAMLAQSSGIRRARAERLQSLAGAGEVARSRAFAGGGSLPEEEMASWALHLDPPCGAEQAQARLRRGNPPVVGRIRKDRLVLDMLTVADGDLPSLAEALKALWR